MLERCISSADANVSIAPNVLIGSLRAHHLGMRGCPAEILAGIRKTPQSCGSGKDATISCLF